MSSCHLRRLVARFLSFPAFKLTSSDVASAWLLLVRPFLPVVGLTVAFVFRFLREMHTHIQIHTYTRTHTYIKTEYIPEQALQNHAGTYFMFLLLLLLQHLYMCVVCLMRFFFFSLMPYLVGHAGMLACCLRR